MKRYAAVGLAFALAFPAVAQSGEVKRFESKKYGYGWELPAEFKMEGKEDKTTTWIYQAGAGGGGGAQPQEKGLVKSLAGRVNVKGVKIAGEAGEAAGGATGGSSGGVEPALSIYCNWTWFGKDFSPQAFQINLDQIKKNIESPDPDYTDLVVMTEKNGYPNMKNGSAFWYKEVDKDGPEEIHRWHILAFGNQSHYTIGLTGTFGQFQKWGKEYEKVIKSFTLIPLEKEGG